MSLLKAQEHLLALRCELRRVWAERSMRGLSELASEGTSDGLDFSDAAYALLRKTDGLFFDIQQLITKENALGNPQR